MQATEKTMAPKGDGPPCSFITLNHQNQIKSIKKASLQRCFRALPKVSNCQNIHLVRAQILGASAHSRLARIAHRLPKNLPVQHAKIEGGHMLEVATVLLTCLSRKTASKHLRSLTTIARWKEFLQISIEHFNQSTSDRLFNPSKMSEILPFNNVLRVLFNESFNFKF